jgi:hypothetical protein
MNAIKGDYYCHDANGRENDYVKDNDGMNGIICYDMHKQLQR